MPHTGPPAQFHAVLGQACRVKIVYSTCCPEESIPEIGNSEDWQNSQEYAHTPPCSCYNSRMLKADMREF